MLRVNVPDYGLIENLTVLFRGKLVLGANTCLEEPSNESKPLFGNMCQSWFEVNPCSV